MTKKEIIASTLIILFIVSLASSSFIIDLFKNDNQAEEIINNSDDKKYVNITFKGELVVEEITFSIPKGKTFSYVLPKLLKYTNDYSIIDIDRELILNYDKTFIIESTDVGEVEDKQIDGLININNASKSELMQLDGIKEKRSLKIIEYRKTKKIESFDELKSVIGVSDAIIEQIKKQATL